MTTSNMFDEQPRKLNFVIHVIWHVPDSYYFIKSKRHVVCPSSIIYVNNRTKWKSQVLLLPKIKLTSETFENFFELEGKGRTLKIQQTKLEKFTENSWEKERFWKNESNHNWKITLRTKDFYETMMKHKTGNPLKPANILMNKPWNLFFQIKSPAVVKSTHLRKKFLKYQWTNSPFAFSSHFDFLWMFMIKIST